MWMDGCKHCQLFPPEPSANGLLHPEPYPKDMLYFGKLVSCLHIRKTEFQLPRFLLKTKLMKCRLFCNKQGIEIASQEMYFFKSSNSYQFDFRKFEVYNSSSAQVLLSLETERSSKDIVLSECRSVV